MYRRVILALALFLAAAPAIAQPQSPSGVLQAPPKNRPATPAGPTPASNPPAPAPRAAVQQVAPMTSPSLLGQSAPGKPTPVVQPPTNTHAQKPPAAKTPPASPKPPQKPVTTAPQTPAAPTTAAAAAAKPVVPPPAAVPDKPVEPGKGTATGQPVPRWASLRSEEVNLRAGPGSRYPVDWVYRRRDLPVEIEREFGTWRLVADQDGVKGWVDAALLVGRRNFVVKGKDRILRKSAADDAAAVAILRAGVVGRIRSCEAAKTWCEMQVGEHRGWLRRDEVWGTYPNEAVN